MMKREIGAADIEVFSNAICEYFEAASGELAQVRSAYLLEGEYPELWSGYHGVIPVHGSFVGSVCFSAPKPLLTHVLMLMGDKSFSEASHLDLVGEIANTLSGQARKHFGETLCINPPLAFNGKHKPVSPKGTGKPYAIPFTWRNYEAGLVVDLIVA
ncbi:MAG: cheX [Proteobacteria bacterium]|nr:cheX [Pseudomonadota bacterium]